MERPPEWERRLDRFRSALADLDVSGPPEAVLLAGASAPGLRLAVLAGSFNPPTAAHLHLADLALTSGSYDAVCFSLAKLTVDKEQITGAPYAERLLLLSLLTDLDARLGLILVNRGLYVEQAEAIRRALRPASLTFLVGFDKIVQIFDARYYTDRDAALRAFFAQAGVAVAPRAGAGDRELAALLKSPENRKFAGAVTLLTGPGLPLADQQLSSTQVRERLARGEDIAEMVPAAILPLLRASSSYRR
ncbi:MAG: hypothetical protein M1118_09985 [Chloroflexi bacterium]|nr:hypothetical protein [Chloroflexota bacterium]